MGVSPWSLSAVFQTASPSPLELTTNQTVGNLNLSAALEPSHSKIDPPTQPYMDTQQARERSS